MEYNYNYNYDAGAVDAGVMAMFGAFFAAYFLIVMVVAVFMIVCMWKVFEKAGKPGWASLVPIYNLVVLLEIVGRPSWWVVLYLLAIIPVINFIGWIPALVVSVVVTLDLAKAFGKDTGFGVLLLLLPIVGYPMLAFGKAEYKKPAVKAAEAK